ncbi:MAG TPA: hypothetical protein VK700_14750 [Steroidobacteraceae bacterium]|jgi:hypothetical protein|nr:hypothetical protein [Steroidobacteraceae bacterium]
MSRTLSMTLPALVAAFIASGALNAQGLGDPRIGSWDEQKTSTDYDSLRRVFVSAANGMTRMIINAKLLQANQLHVDFNCDGSAYRVLTQDGRFSGLTYSCRHTAARSFDFSSKRGPADAGVTLAHGTSGDWVTASGTETVSADGRTYETTAVLRFPDGHTRQSQRQFVLRGP